MPRLKGSKNKPKTGKLSSAAEINALKAQLKANRAALKATDNAIAKLETKKVNAEAKAALDAQKTELDSTVQKLLTEGMTMDQIIGKLNQ